MKKFMASALIAVMILCSLAGCAATPSPEASATPTVSETPFNPGGGDHGGGAGMVTPTPFNPGGGDHGGGAGMVTPTPAS